MTRLPLTLLMWLGVLTVSAQTLDNRSLSGKYFFRQLFIASDARGAVNEARSLLGVITFDGAGRYGLAGQQNIGTAAAAGIVANGAYTVSPAGFVTLTNPARPALAVNARLGTGALIGSTTETTTETTENVFDLFVAIPAPASAVGLQTLNAPYWGVSIEMTAASAAQIRNSRFLFRPNGIGGIVSFDISGHAASYKNGQPFTETVSGAAYTLAADGAGTANFPGSALLAQAKILYASADGSLVLGGSTAAGAHDLLFAVKQSSGAQSNASWKDKFWAAGFRLDGKTFSAFSASANADGAGRLIWTQRVRQTAATAIDFSGAVPYALGGDGSGRSLASWVAVGAGGAAFAASTEALESAGTYEIYLGVRAPVLSGSGVFLNPLGVLNTASYAPPGGAIAPGEFLSLYGSGLAPRFEQVQTRTFPTVMSGVSVTFNNTPAPLYFVSPERIAALVPFSVEGPQATIVVNNNGSRSNAVDVSVARTAPGVFAQNQAGTGIGAIEKADFSVVSGANPVHRKDTILVFLTGMGAVSPAVPDGTPGAADPLSQTVQKPIVRIGGKVAIVNFSGLAPCCTGLYQINVVTPDDAPFGDAVPLSIETAEHFHDQVDIPVER